MTSRVSGRRNRATQAEADEKTLQRRVARLSYEVSVLIGQGEGEKADRKQVALDEARRELAELYEA